MLAETRYQRSRYELKYMVDEPCARRVRDFVRSYLQRDRHAIAEMRYSYPIYSIYLDAPDLALYRATTQAQKNRFKLRVRYYDHDPNGPLFCEIKRRVNDVIFKQRAVIRRQSLADLMAGRCPCPDDLLDPSHVDSYHVLRDFSALRNALHAEPKIIVYYEREAWISPTDSTLRVTFDREAAAARYEGLLQPAQWTDGDLQGVVLELKFDDRFPLWMRELVRSLNLSRTNMGKYVYCMDRLPARAARFEFCNAP